ncbi:tyrosine-type recombinase/integrase [Stenotrophomonas maltophilia]|uniref:tyrosine-type recombinase/integrase n=1 Tax=Stenotrophomonas maltophilia TaxID=40324 RepID=UPI0012FDD598
MNTGMRRGELLSMTWADINWEAKMLTIQAENAKSGRQRHIPLNVEAMEVLQRWATQADERRAGNVFDVTDIKKGWGKLIADARIERKSVCSDRVPVRAGLTVTFAGARNAAVCPMLSATKPHAA